MGLTVHHIIHMLNPTQTQVLQHCVRREAHCPVSENSLVAVEWLGSAWAFCLPPPRRGGTWVTKLTLNLYIAFKCNGEAYFCYGTNPAHLFQGWILLPSMGLVIWKNHRRKAALAQEQTVALLTTKRWVFESNQRRFQWRLILSLSMVKQTHTTPLANPSLLLIYKGGNFQDVLAVDNKTFFKNTLRVSKTTFEMSNIF